MKNSKDKEQVAGSRFLELIESDIKKLDINKIVLTTSKGFPSEKFYIKNGFKTSLNAILLAK